MTRREVCGTVVKVALGAAAGVVLTLARDAFRGPAAADPPASARRAEALDRPRAPTVDEMTRIDPSTAPVPCANALVPRVVTRDRDAPIADPSDDELARLREQVVTLEREVQRLRALLAENGVRRHTLRKLVSANDLQHGRLYEELLGLIVDDPEGVAEDPRRAFETIVRLIDETGLASGKRGEGVFAIAPEPAAPDLRLEMDRSSSDQQVDPEDGTPSFVRHEDQVSFHARIILSKVPERWLGDPLSATIELSIGVSNRDTGSLRLVMDAGSTRLAPEVSWHLQWRDGEAYLDRCPYRGADESLVTSPAEVAKERSWADRVFQQLMTRAR